MRNVALRRGWGDDPQRALADAIVERRRHPASLAVDGDGQGRQAAVDPQPVDIVEPDHVVAASQADEGASGGGEEARHALLAHHQDAQLAVVERSRCPAPGIATR